MSIKSEILTLQHIRFDLSLKIADMERTIRKAKGVYPDCMRIQGIEKVCADLRQLYDETTHELCTNPVYTRAYPALCAIGMPDDVKRALLGERGTETTETDGENDEKSVCGNPSV